jgi:hypothetical protein
MCATVPQFPHDLQYGRLKDPPSPGTIASWSLPLFPPTPWSRFQESPTMQRCPGHYCRGSVEEQTLLASELRIYIWQSLVLRLC